VLLGRRGPVQAAFTNPELREPADLVQADVVVEPAQMEVDPASQAHLESDAADATEKRNIETLKTLRGGTRTVIVEYADWTAIDQHERTSGEAHSRPRIKLVRHEDLLRRAATIRV
jgi:hypothetical protein